MTAENEQRPISPLPIRALIVGGHNLKGGDKNLLLHAAQALEAAEVVTLPAPRNYDFLAAIEDAAEKAKQGPPRINVFLSCADTRADLADERLFARERLSPALWLNLNNDQGDANKDMRGIGTDLQISPAACRDIIGKEDPPGICYLDALPAVTPKIGRDEAIRYFRENHELTLKAPVTLVAIGYADADIPSLVAALPRDGTVLVTTGPRTGDRFGTSSKSPRLARLAATQPADKLTPKERLWRLTQEFMAPERYKLFRRADLFHVFSSAGDNPYGFMLAAADYGIATSDSWSTPSDFIAAKIPLALASGGGAFYNQYQQAFPLHLVKSGYACWIDGEKTLWPPPPERPRPAEIMRARVSDLLWRNFRAA